MTAAGGPSPDGPAGLADGHPGLADLAVRPLLETVWHRRTHRVSRGASVPAGSMSYRSTHTRQPLSELEGRRC
ncbi:hypothetical protein [Streptomyces sp. NPDC059786]|uniref:hypothetical protein n=1 Tax=Streptomyces sp. NPDC059786 TaxID=3346946 RepID=UPI00364A18C5